MTNWSRSKRLAVYAKTGNRCIDCGFEFTVPDGYDGRHSLVDPGYRDRRGVPRLRCLELDHVHPRLHGGTDDLANLEPRCTPCNIRKGARILAAVGA